MLMGCLKLALPFLFFAICLFNSCQFVVNFNEKLCGCLLLSARKIGGHATCTGFPKEKKLQKLLFNFTTAKPIGTKNNKSIKV